MSAEMASKNASEMLNKANQVKYHLMDKTDELEQLLDKLNQVPSLVQRANNEVERLTAEFKATVSLENYEKADLLDRVMKNYLLLVTKLQVLTVTEFYDMERAEKESIQKQKNIGIIVAFFVAVSLVSLVLFLVSVFFKFLIRAISPSYLFYPLGCLD